jgi:hypothetical protein
MSMENNEIKREKDTGRYAPTVERPCECGHDLGVHSADRVKGYQPCFSGDLGGEDCDCECFKRVRKPRTK